MFNIAWFKSYEINVRWLLLYNKWENCHLEWDLVGPDSYSVTCAYTHPASPAGHTIRKGALLVFVNINQEIPWGRYNLIWIINEKLKEVFRLSISYM